MNAAVPSPPLSAWLQLYCSWHVLNADDLDMNRFSPQQKSSADYNPCATRSHAHADVSDGYLLCHRAASLQEQAQHWRWQLQTSRSLAL